MTQSRLCRAHFGRDKHPEVETTKILLVEDDELISGPLALRLRDSGYEVWMADNGREGFALAIKETPNVVVLDIMTPEMEGWEVCQALLPVARRGRTGTRPR